MGTSRTASSCAAAILASSAGAFAQPPVPQPGPRPRKGAVCQNRRVGPAYWKAAAEVGLAFVRLIPIG